MLPPGKPQALCLYVHIYIYIYTPVYIYALLILVLRLNPKNRRLNHGVLDRQSWYFVGGKVLLKTTYTTQHSSKKETTTWYMKPPLVCPISTDGKKGFIHLFSSGFLSFQSAFCGFVDGLNPLWKNHGLSHWQDILSPTFGVNLPDTNLKQSHWGDDWRKVRKSHLISDN